MPNIKCNEPSEPLLAHVVTGDVNVLVISMTTRTCIDVLFQDNIVNPADKQLFVNTATLQPPPDDDITLVDPSHNMLASSDDRSAFIILSSFRMAPQMCCF